MEAYNTTIYPVFEADQVLSQKDLNLLVSHLEEQDRITRKNLIGLGIVCGLEISSPSENSVKISCGTAVTSLGFQINWKEKVFTHYHDYEISEQFLKPDYLQEPHLDSIFKYASQYEPVKNCMELVTSASDDNTKKPLTKDFLSDKIVVLLLEISLIDQKNCVNTNCDDKGKRMEFNLRPLIYPIEGLNTDVFHEHTVMAKAPKLTFPRYNVDPYINITTGNDVLKQFNKVYSDSFVISVSDAVSILYTDFKNNYGSNTNFPVLQNCKNKINEIVSNYKSTINIQYLWDWIYDITEAYNEIAASWKINPAICCVNEGLFPFHVALGNGIETGAQYRTPFITTLNKSQEEQAKLKQLELLFDRLNHIINSFSVPANGKIKVTPSVYGKAMLSEKAIPYYYGNMLQLNKKWSPELTANQENDSILSYHSDIAGYSNTKAVKQPLLFDIEPYNFFRIEGHLGMNYKSALKDLTLIKNSNSLPFKITALNAVDFADKEVDIMKFEGRWDDLETDYDLARKRLYNITEFVFNWMNTRRNKLISENILSGQTIDNFKNILQEIKNLLTNDLKEFLPNFTSFYEIFKELNNVFLLHRWCIQLNRETLSVLAEDLIDRLDDINELFLEDPFAVIYEEAHVRWQNVYKDLFFSTFIKKHSGLEHKAGVTKGGTFILVYVDSSIFKAAAPPPSYANLLASVKAYKNNIAIADDIKVELEKSIKFKDYKSQIKTKPTTTTNPCKDETENIKAYLMEIAKYKLDTTYTAEMSGFILENFKDLLQFAPTVTGDNQNNSLEQLVIADFFLPYTCCSDGNTIEIKLETAAPPKIEMETLEYCNNDMEGEYEVFITGKSGGNFTGTAKDAIVQHSDRYFFTPGHNSVQTPQTYTLQYEVGGEVSNTLEIAIQSPQELAWSFKRDANKPSVFMFKNTNANDTHSYEFDFGDGSDTIIADNGTANHNFNFSNSQEFNITITQLGEICRSTQTIVVTAVGDFNAKDFNSNDFYTD